mmetsp:Transcript_2389/g.6927  ORF Transcript_2389/g.6927 Transcript_2389/m.6927 type:complete len:225 (-) Transcript_2389:911-1585(-)
MRSGCAMRRCSMMRLPFAACWLFTASWPPGCCASPAPPWQQGGRRSFPCHHRRHLSLQSFPSTSQRTSSRHFSLLPELPHRCWTWTTSRSLCPSSSCSWAATSTSRTPTSAPASRRFSCCCFLRTGCTVAATLTAAPPPSPLPSPLCWRVTPWCSSTSCLHYSASMWTSSTPAETRSFMRSSTSVTTSARSWTTPGTSRSTVRPGRPPLRTVVAAGYTSSLPTC